ncbi:arsenate reductase (glutaredoxin) [Ichthyenterobacterium sp. W332]|uniref:Arsenate reductase (Glutaredoxin) n=1 Tax=Microcosmobacter mediterraneus TaxID=3075607 RepID=A0ABU2YKW6_9FLAO|nr:arsenate reductase (glutaredoxin) [Ichthyenterobacterium sp. W332]MDT0558799.1 arsenate reductase (glutaredoxin) [Ichthyenterobacterium sp. W332]
MSTSTVTIYHNPRCRKSREGLQFLENSGQLFDIIKYLDDVPSASELKKIIAKLDIKPIDLIRKNEALWKAEFKGKTLSDSEIIFAMVKNPKLIERPIIINGNKAVIGRPTENINDIL